MGFDLRRDLRSSKPAISPGALSVCNREVCIIWLCRATKESIVKEISVNLQVNFDHSRAALIPRTGTHWSPLMGNVDNCLRYPTQHLAIRPAPEARRLTKRALQGPTALGLLRFLPLFNRIGDLLLNQLKAACTHLAHGLPSAQQPEDSPKSGSVTKLPSSQSV